MDTTLSFGNQNNALTWDDWLALYCSYKSEHGREPVQKTVYCGRSLGHWCRDQRQAFSKGRLSPDRLQRLTDVGFVFAVRTMTWDRWIQLFLSYKNEYGKYPTTDCVYQEQNLGVWCSNQRQAFYRGKLSENQIRQLLDIGFVFDAHDAAWNEWFALYRKYKDEYGREPSRHAIYHRKHLGRWCEHQKNSLRKGELSMARTQMLNEVNFGLKMPSAVWVSWVNLYREYKQEFGCEPAARTIYRDKNLGTWCVEQRRNWRSGKLSKNRIRDLSTAGFIFDINDATWDGWLDLYREYKSKTGIEPVKNTVFCGKKLGYWCENQKTNYRKGRLSAERIQKLNTAGFAFFSQRYMTWNEWFDLYCEYKREYGVEPVRSTVYRQKNLGHWCHNQKNRYRKGAISEERVQRLRSVDFPLPSDVSE